jgi:hypothetical protein
MVTPIDLDALEALHLIAPDAIDLSSPVAEALTRKFYTTSRAALPALIAECRRLRAIEAAAVNAMTQWTDLDLWLGDEVLSSDTDDAWDRMATAIQTLQTRTKIEPTA